MAQKNVVLTINQPPFGSIHYVEGLRAAVGVISGLDEHQLSVVYLGDGVYSALKDVKRDEQMGYLGILNAKDVKVAVERESLNERGISEDNVYDQFEVIGRNEVLDLINNADSTIDF